MVMAEPVTKLASGGEVRDEARDLGVFAEAPDRQQRADPRAHFVVVVNVGRGRSRLNDVDGDAARRQITRDPPVTGAAFPARGCDMIRLPY